jgi:DNA-binding LacI/PurR family transcriptional regulator
MVSALNPLQLLHGVTKAAHAAGYALEVVYVPGDVDARTERLADIAASEEYEGILSFSPLHPLELASEHTQTIVLSLSEFDEQMHVTGEFTDAAPVVEMMEHLVELGHRRFLHVTGDLTFPSAVARRSTYLATIERLGLESLGDVEGSWRGVSGFDAVTALPDDTPPFALIAANDIVAAGAIRAASLRGWSVPGQMSVTGWDDNAQSEYLLPPLTTVVQDHEALGVNSMRRLIAAVRGEEMPPAATGLQSVVWRESVGAPSGTASDTLRQA